jgi:hypothetical protein
VAKVLSTAHSAPAAWASSTVPMMSTTPSSGLVGVSTQTSRVSDRMACLSWSRLVMSTTLSRSPHPSNSRAATR